ncbi:unnamed protein product [Heterosigma akashiwo]
MGNAINYAQRRLCKPFSSLNQTPRFQRYMKYHSTEGPKDGLTWIGGVCVTINLLMGSGFLALPRAVEESGLLLAPAVLVGAVLLLRTTGLYEAEIMCRAEAVVAAQLQPRRKTIMQKTPQDAMKLKQHAYSMVELCEIFGGTGLTRLYVGLITFYLLCCCTGYAVVFAAALSAYVPLPWANAGCTCQGGTAAGCADLRDQFVLLFALAALPLSLIGVKEQATFQATMTVARVAVATVMVGSCVWAAGTGDQLFGNEYGNPGQYGPAETGLANWGGLLTVVPLALFSQNINAYIALVVGDLRCKAHLGSVVTAGMLVTCGFYALIGCSVAYYFGPEVAPTANVMWETFGAAEGGVLRGAGLFVLLFPALDVVGIFPLNAIAAAQNLMAATYHDRMDKAESDKFIVRFFRLVTSLTPILLALFVGSNLDTVLCYAGTCAVLICMIIPPFLNLKSQKYVKEHLGFSNADTPFSGPMSKPAVLKSLMGVGALLFCFVFVNTTFQQFFQRQH